MVIGLLSRSFLQSTVGRTNNGLGLTVAAGAMAARYQGALEDQVNHQWPLMNYIQNRGAARKGKRIQRARDARLKAAKRRLLEAQNPKLRNKNKNTVKVDKTQFRFFTERQLDLTMPDSPPDNVFFVEKFKKKKFSLNDILEFHRQVVHPDVMNQPDALVSATIELNLKMKIKKKKYIERIETTVCYPHLYKYQLKPRRILALAKDDADQDAAREAGASVVGALDLVDQLKKNQLTQRDFDHLVCHTNFLVEFAGVKGMKGQPYFPNKARANFGMDMGALVAFFKNGVDYSLKRNPDEPEFGFIECHFGKLDMTNEQLHENLLTLFNSVNRFKPLNLDDNKQFFERVMITTPATSEIFLLKFWEMMDDYEDPSLIGLDEDDTKGDASSKEKATSS